MKLLLDTHAFVWLASDLKRLPAKARSALKESAGRLFLSSASTLEVALLTKRGRLELPLAVADYIELALAHHGIQEVAIDRRIAVRSALLPDIHNDPFDRLIVATGLIGDMVVLTKDEKIRAYDVRTVWS